MTYHLNCFMIALAISFVPVSAIAADETELEKLLQTGDQVGQSFGFSVASAEGMITIGAPRDKVNGV